jgi:hypothetical protein
VYLLVFMRNLLMHLAEKILLMQPLTFGGDYPDRLTKNLSSSQVLASIGVNLTLIWINEDLNVCDYTVLGNDIVKK